MSNSAANVEIELQSLIANKMGKFLAIIMKITFYRKKIAILSRKTSNFEIKASWIDHRLLKRKYLLTQQFFDDLYLFKSSFLTM